MVIISKLGDFNDGDTKTELELAFNIKYTLFDLRCKITTYLNPCHAH